MKTVLKDLKDDLYDIVFESTNSWTDVSEAAFKKAYSEGHHNGVAIRVRIDSANFGYILLADNTWIRC